MPKAQYFLLTAPRDYFTEPHQRALLAEGHFIAEPFASFDFAAAEAKRRLIAQPIDGYTITIVRVEATAEVLITAQFHLVDDLLDEPAPEDGTP